MKKFLAVLSLLLILTMSFIGADYTYNVVQVNQINYNLKIFNPETKIYFAKMQNISGSVNQYIEFSSNESAELDAEETAGQNPYYIVFETNETDKTFNIRVEFSPFINGDNKLGYGVDVYSVSSSRLDKISGDERIKIAEGTGYFDYRYYDNSSSAIQFVMAPYYYLDDLSGAAGGLEYTSTVKAIVSEGAN